MGYPSKHISHRRAPCKSLSFPKFQCTTPSSNNLFFSSPQFGLLAYLTFILSVSFAKMSMLVFYTRLAPQTWVRAAAYGGVLVVVAYSLTAILVESLGCRPLRGIVDETLSDVDGGCDGSYPGYIAVSCMNIVMDVVILLLPIPIVVPLQIPTRQKVLLVLTFATGVL